MSTGGVQHGEEIGLAGGVRLSGVDGSLMGFSPASSRCGVCGVCGVCVVCVVCGVCGVCGVRVSLTSISCSWSFDNSISSSLKLSITLSPV